MKTFFALSALLLPTAILCAMEVNVLREDLIDSAIPRFGNGSSPAWNFASPMIVRIEDDVWFSLSRPVEGVPPYANTIWQVFRRQEDGWEVILESPGPMDREPCPLVALNHFTLAVFANPKVSFNRFRPENNAILWNSRPQLLAFPSAMETPVPFLIEPEFSGDPVLREHTYRAIAVNPANSEVFVMVQDPDSERYHPSYLDPMGQWHPQPAFEFPHRGLYANAHVRDGRVHLVAVSDIQEPVPEWRASKFRQFNRHWDYAYRNLYYAWSPDVLEDAMREPLLVDSIEERPGHIRNLDLLVDGEGTAHVLYLKKRFKFGFLRDEFFPDETMSVSIGYARIEAGVLQAKADLVEGLMEPDESASDSESTLIWGRLHQLEDGTIVMIYTDRADGLNRTWLLPIESEGTPGERVSIPLQQTLGSVFFTNTERGGSRPSNRIDLLEIGWGKTHHEVRYAEIEVSH